MTDWPELERRLTDSARSRSSRRWRAWTRLALVPIAAGLVTIALVALMRTPTASDERTVAPPDERVTTPTVVDGGHDPNEPTAPGLHGTELDAAAYGDKTLQAGAVNRLTYVEGQPFVVVFTNGGENDEFNVKVSVRLRPENGDAITLSQSVPEIAQGERATVRLALDRQPPIGRAVTIEVDVAKVPGEKTHDSRDNNRASYPVLFAKG